MINFLHNYERPYVYEIMNFNTRVTKIFQVARYFSRIEVSTSNSNHCGVISACWWNPSFLNSPKCSVNTTNDDGLPIHIK